jgi:hypothetical protein
MVSIIGTFQNGNFTLDKHFSAKKPVKVIVNFLEEIQFDSDEPLDLDSFSFSESKKNLKNFKGSFSEAVIEERRSE